jgi:hypothetical protein
MSGKAPKQKGNRIERECVNIAKEYGFKSKRAWGSDGRSLGWHEEVDIIIETPDHVDPDCKLTNPYKFQVKGRKAIADYLKPCDEVYGQILKEDRKEALVTIRYKDLLDLFKMISG